MQPTTFINILTSITALSLGVSVWIKNKTDTVNQKFLFFTLMLSVYFLISIYSENLRYYPYVLLFSIIVTSFIGYKFFEDFLPTEKISGFLKSEYILTLLMIVMVVYNFVRNDKNRIFILKVIAFLYVVFSLIFILKNILQSKRTTESIYVNKRLTYLFRATLFFGITLIISQIFIKNGFFYYLGYVVTLFYLYFVSQILLQHRLMDFSELFVKVLLLAGMTVMVTSVYLLMIFWIPLQNNEFLVLNIVVASVLVLILIDPFEHIVSHWIGGIFFNNTKKLRKAVFFLGEELKYIQDTESDLAELVVDTLMETGRIDSIALYFSELDTTDFKLADSRGLPLPPKLMIADFQEILDRLKHHAYVTKEEINQEADKFRWSSSIKNGTLIKIKNQLHELNITSVIPIKRKNEILGLMCLSGGNKPPFSYRELTLFSDVVSYIGNALINMDKHKKLLERKHLIALGSMSAGLAHEIRNPLGSIKGSIQILSEAKYKLDESEVEFLDIIEEEVERLNRVVSNFLDFSKSKQLNKKVTDIKQLINKTIKLIPLEKNIEIRFLVNTDNYFIKIDEDKLIQVFLNILLNASDAVKQQKSPLITIVLSEAKNKKLKIEIKDNGVGISKEHLEKIFIPFFTAKDSGTGLGLAISKKIIEAHEGDLYVKSQKEQGSIFTIIIG